jgi:hypothetical protein
VERPLYFVSALVIVVLVIVIVMVIVIVAVASPFVCHPRRGSAFAVAFAVAFAFLLVIPKRSGGICFSTHNPRPATEAVAVVLAFACPFVCHSAAQQRNLLLPLSYRRERRALALRKSRRESGYRSAEGRAKPERAKRPELLPLVLPLLFSCHPSPQGEDLLLFLPSPAWAPKNTCQAPKNHNPNKTKEINPNKVGVPVPPTPL